MNGTGITSYRTVFLSDIHLGTRWCRAKELCAFLSAIRCERLYLVGDIIDGWKLGRRPKWRRAHDDVLRWLLRMSKRMEIVYIPGNHDTFMDAFDGKRFGSISVRKEAVHENADGRSFLVVHGDEFDAAVRRRKWLAWFGDRAYRATQWMNALLNALRSFLGFGYWSLSQFLKQKVKRAAMRAGRFDEVLVRSALGRGVDGVVCGHIHNPAIRNLRGLVYANCGDWIENCSALVEHFDGSMEVVRWGRERISPCGNAAPASVSSASAASAARNAPSVPG